MIRQSGHNISEILFHYTTVFLTNLDRLRHRTVPHRTYRFLSVLRLKSVKNGEYGRGTVR